MYAVICVVSCADHDIVADPTDPLSPSDFNPGAVPTLGSCISLLSLELSLVAPKLVSLPCVS